MCLQTKEKNDNLDYLKACGEPFTSSTQIDEYITSSYFSNEERNNNFTWKLDTRETYHCRVPLAYPTHSV